MSKTIAAVGAFSKAAAIGGFSYLIGVVYATVQIAANTPMTLSAARAASAGVVVPFFLMLAGVGVTFAFWLAEWRLD